MRRSCAVPAPAAARRAGRIVLASALGLTVLALPVTAHADVTSKPARTWGTNGRVSVILPVGDRIYLGGSFTSIVDPSGKSYPAKNLAVVDAVTGAGDLNFSASTDTGIGTEVLALATDGQRLFVGGLFKSVDGSSRSNLAAVNLFTGALVDGWNASATASVDALNVAGGNLYAGGLFANIRNPGGAQSQPYLAKLDPATGAVDTAWSVRADDRVRALTAATDNTSRLFIGGDFLNVNGLVRRRAAAVTTTDPGAVDVLFKPGPNNGTTYSQIIGLTADADHLYAAVGGGGGACTAYNGSTGSTVWSDHTNGNLQSVNLLGGLLYCGGHFGGTGSFAASNGTFDRQHLAAVNPGDGSVSGFSPRVNSALGVWSMAADPGHLYVGGDFTTVTGVSQPHFAEFPTTQTVPTAPTLFAQPGDAVVHLSWTVPSTDGGSSLNKYNIYRRLSSGAYSSTPLASLSSGTRTYDDSAVSNATTYAYNVVALNGVGPSPASGDVSATPQAGILAKEPDPPVGLTAANPAGYVQLTWNPPTDNGGAPIVQYKIYRGTASGSETLYDSTGSTSYQDVVVSSGMTYFYRVTAVNSATLQGLPSNEDSTTAQPGVPGPPVLTGSAGPGVAHLSWTVPPNGGTPITGYTVLRDNIRVKNLAAGTTNWDDTGVSSGVKYVYQVRAKNAQGNGQNSNKVTLTPS